MPYLLAIVLSFFSIHVYSAGFDSLKALDNTGARVSAMAVLMNDKRTVIGSLNASQSLAPASISKLYVAAYALDTLSPYYRFQTQLLSTDKVNNKGQLPGDLILYGAGDPSLDNAGVWQMVIDLKFKQKLKQINGNIVINQSRFGEITCDGIDRCNAQKVSRNAYDAPISAAGINYASWCVSVTPATVVGELAQVADCRIDIKGLTLDNKVKTVAKGRPRQINVIRKTVNGRETIRLKGQIPMGQRTHRVYRSTSNAAMLTAKVLKRSLDELGIRVRGSILVQNSPIPREPVVLASHDGQQLSHQLNSMLLWSSNYMADLLMINTASRRLNLRPNLPQAAQDLSAFALASNQHLPAHIKQLTSTPLLLNGSGLNPANRISSADMIGLLSSMFTRHEVFPAFVGGMTLPKYSYSSRLRRAPDEWRENLMVKTGTLSYPVTVSALAGYFRCKDGKWGAFSTMVNGTPSKPSVGYRKINQALYNDLGQIISSC